VTKRYAPATERNREAILAVLHNYLPDQGTVLEIASGTGQHAIFLAQHLTSCHWLPTDMDATNLASITAWREEADVANLLPPRQLDVRDSVWAVDCDLPAPVSAIVNINMLHISPWSCCEALFAGAAKVLNQGAVVMLYGPFKRDGLHTAPSNTVFDEQLRSQDPEWGVRDLKAVVDVAMEQEFACQRVIEMPANNLSVVFEKG
jgi:cyclopropane fatty-acyl-phospholipid synthase-like methyltransferase